MIGDLKLVNSQPYPPLFSASASTATEGLGYREPPDAVRAASGPEGQGAMAGDWKGDAGRDRVPHPMRPSARGGERAGGRGCGVCGQA